MKKISFLILVALTFLSTQCDEDDVVDYDGICDDVVLVDESLYKSFATDEFEFLNVEIVDDCLSIKVGSSGCDTETWGFGLVDSEAIAESLPEQRNIKFQLINKQVCDAYFEKTVTFNLEPLQINNSVNQVILHLDGWEPALTYSY